MRPLVNLEAKGKCPDQECLSILSMFLDDQRAVSCPLQDRHLLLFGHSEPSLQTLYLRKKSGEWRGEGGSLKNAYGTLEYREFLILANIHWRSFSS